MEWLLLAVVVLATAAFVAPAFRESGREGPGPAEAARQAREERRRIMGEFRAIDAARAAGRLSAEERLARRRALAPRLLAAAREPGTRPEREA